MHNVTVLDPPDKADIAGETPSDHPIQIEDTDLSVGPRWSTSRAVLVTALLLATIAVPLWSYAGYLIAPGSAGWDQRSVEWMRDHGGGGAVNTVEQWWYTRNPPGDGVPESSRLPDVPAPIPARAPTVDGSMASSAPGDIPARIDAAPGEGQWQPTAQSVDGVPVMYTTFVRPDRDNSSVVSGLAWFDQHLVRTVAVPGTREPGGQNWAWDSGIPAIERGPLLAAFNAGFRYRDITGGYFAEGRTIEPLRDGHASLAIDRSGTVDVVEWGRDATMSPDVVSVRQSLHLIVDGGQPVPGLADNADGLWGIRRHQLQYTWRSGIGVTADGNLVVAAGPQLTLTALADALTQAGAVRGMQLDIHTKQVTVNLFTPRDGTTAAIDAVKLLPTMPKPATRYLAPDQRDFFAVFVR